MKTTFGFSLLFLLMTTTVLICSLSCVNGGMSSTWQEKNELSLTIKSRKLQSNLQDNGYGPSTVDEGEAGKINLEDYRHPMDPVPSSKASVRPGPIEHGTPLMPYIPKQPPPPPPPTRSKPVVGFP
ncbi:uncharacterized protein LOC107869459 isoform X2 [Capsicum annuum]|uniref:uncharacterized protein LOC107869459 isoform X2 n=1 Tax=Capsicum annuum TaxID=4072 RepID=UPI0007BEDE1A|nr:uncharacterized protein LOC107869459 isoform X2 [Capsicum annuum]